MTNAPTSRVRWLLIFWIFVLSAVAFLDRMADRVHEMSLSEPDTAIDKERIVCFSGFICGTLGRCVGKLIARSDNKFIKRIFGI